MCDASASKNFLPSINSIKGINLNNRSDKLAHTSFNSFMIVSHAGQAPGIAISIAAVRVLMGLDRNSWEKGKLYLSFNHQCSLPLKFEILRQPCDYISQTNTVMWSMGLTNKI